MYSVLACGDDEVWFDALCAVIDRERDFHISAKAYDGKTALEIIEKTRPEVIILDIIMPEYDGLYIINHIRKKMGAYNPVIYVVSSVKSGAAASVLSELRADCSSLKPVSVDTVLKNLKSAVSGRNLGAAVKDKPLNAADTYEMIRVTADRLGMLPHRTSTKCAVEALVSYSANPGQPRALTKVLYPEIARKLGLTETAVEKNIRNAVLRIQACETELYRRIFKYSPSGKISNGNFLSAVSGYIAGQLENADVTPEQTAPQRPQ